MNKSHLSVDFGDEDLQHWSKVWTPVFLDLYNFPHCRYTLKTSKYVRHLYDW